MARKFIHNLSKQFRARGLNMSAWAENNNVSIHLLLQVAAGIRTGKRNGKTKEIMKLLDKEGFVYTTPEKAA